MSRRMPTTKKCSLRILRRLLGEFKMGYIIVLVLRLHVYTGPSCIISSCRISSKLLALGCPAHVQPGAKPKAAVSTESPTDKEFRDLAMHGSLERMKEIGAQANPDAQEAGSGRTSLHKAAYFGHVAVIRYLVIELGATVDLQDTDGDTALHEAARFGHVDCVTTLLAAGASRTIQNADGKTALDLAAANEKEEVVALLGLNANNGEKEDDCVGCVIL